MNNLRPQAIISACNKGALIGVLLVNVAAGVPLALAQESGGFSRTRLTQIAPVSKSPNSKNSCLSFEAAFSGPLKEKPNAIVDIENLHTIEGVISILMNVSQQSKSRYRLDLFTDDEACKALISNKDDNISVTVDGGTGSDGLPILPDERNFKAGRFQKR
ncbi:MAG TPA: hypothetical protein VI895_05660 [Bdellovibrionota bacterium]|nr:hypothetical protein [Bdellovibrionota bacterium]